jgi:uncharacterized protein YndB with AHSA1/START domain
MSHVAGISEPSAFALRAEGGWSTMFTVIETVFIARPPREVFDYLTDGRNRPQWDATVISEEVTSEGPVGVGSTIYTRMRAMGREVDFHWLVTAFDPPTRMAIVSTEGMLPTSTILDFAASGAGCTATATIEGDPPGMLRIVEPMIAGGVRSTLAEGLARAKVVLESGSG